MSLFPCLGPLPNESQEQEALFLPAFYSNPAPLLFAKTTLSPPRCAAVLWSRPHALVRFLSAPHRGRRRLPPDPVRGHSRTALPHPPVAGHRAHRGDLAAVPKPGPLPGRARVPGRERPGGRRDAGIQGADGAAEGPGRGERVPGDPPSPAGGPRAVPMRGPDRKPDSGRHRDPAGGRLVIFKGGTEVPPRPESWDAVTPGVHLRSVRMKPETLSPGWEEHGTVERAGPQVARTAQPPPGRLREGDQGSGGDRAPTVRRLCSPSPSSSRLRPLHPREGLRRWMDPAGVQDRGMVSTAFGPVERPSRQSASTPVRCPCPGSWALPDRGVQQSQGQHAGERVLHRPQCGPRPREDHSHAHSR